MILIKVFMKKRFCSASLYYSEIPVNMKLPSDIRLTGSYELSWEENIHISLEIRAEFVCPT